jgi:hypothetical protein
LADETMPRGSHCPSLTVAEVFGSGSQTGFNSKLLLLN